MPSGGTRIGSGAPAGNTNALKTGRYSPRYARAACVIALAPSFHEVMHALRRSHRALGGDPAARRRDYEALMAGAHRPRLPAHLRDAVLFQALLARPQRLCARPPHRRPSAHPNSPRARSCHGRPPRRQRARQENAASRRSLDHLILERLDSPPRPRARARARLKKSRKTKTIKPHPPSQEAPHAGLNASQATHHLTSPESVSPRPIL